MEEREDNLFYHSYHYIIQSFSLLFNATVLKLK